MINLPSLHRTALTLLALAGLAAAPAASGQALRTWVSGGAGDDANPCSRTAPGKTFAGALSRTAANGEIDVIDPGEFGGPKITQAVTIDGGFNLAGVLVDGTDGITINAGDNDTVVLRNLDINGASASPNGINILHAGAVRIENCTILGFTTGVNVSVSSNAQVSLKNVTISNCTTEAVTVSPRSALVSVAADNLTVHFCASAVSANTGAKVYLRNSDLSQNTNALTAATGSTVELDTVAITGCSGTAVNTTGGLVRLTNDSVFDNGVGLATSNGGKINSFTNNKFQGNATTVGPTKEINQN